MGYESRVLIMDRKEVPPSAVSQKHAYADPIAKFDMGVMGYGYHRHFREIFTNPIDFDLWDGSSMTRTDRYGEAVMYCTLPELLAELERREANTHYRRVPPLIAYVKALHPEEWDGLIAVHYGH